MRIFAWAADGAGCWHYRLKLPFDQLRARGHTAHVAQVMVGGSVSPLGIREEWGDAEVIVGQRVCLPGPSGTWQDLAKRPNRPMLVYEVDDDLLAVDPSNREAWEFFNKPGIQANIAANVKVADLVTVSTEPLADVMRLLNPNVVVLPNCVPRWLLDHQVPARTDGVVTVGWQGSQTHHMDWDGPGKQVERFFKSAPAGSVDLHLMGAPPPTAPHIPGTMVTPWTGDVPDYYRAIDWHVTLAPLRPHIFNRSKSPLRCLEAAALGLPVIASNAGPYEGFVQHGSTGYVVRQDHEWGKYLRVLVNDEAVRREMGAAAREQASAWTIEERAIDWERAYTAQLSPVGVL